MTQKRYRTIDIERPGMIRFPGSDLKPGQWYEWEQAPMRVVEIYLVNGGLRSLVGRVENASEDQVRGEEMGVDG